VDRAPEPGGAERDAERGSASSLTGESHAGPHVHPGEGGVCAGPSAAEKSVRHRAAVPQPRRGYRGND